MFRALFALFALFQLAESTRLGQCQRWVLSCQYPIYAVEALIPEPLLLLATPEHPPVHAPSVQARDLECESLILTEAGCSYRTLLERVLQAEGVFPATTLGLSSVEAIKQCAIAGMGMAFLPALTMSTELAQGRLAVVPWKGHPFQVMTQMLWHKEK